ncbi:transcriptional regulator [Bradyrhizobium roseum]|uniref:transcriptional regulator n=1 Tax=Bradyrhizobium roseum TaxID=3056648 RepID=UPI002617A0AD|nr:transcriptional regulator [Bradyrhizobium roseus]WKA26379.1 transcriptional regulator [Bradyrhizobium roseus]
MTDEERDRRIAHVEQVRQTLAETHPHLKDFEEFLGDFNKETERGAALAAAAYIDGLLESTLIAFLIPNDSGLNLITGFNAPLGTLSARNAACHAMGLISELEFKECDLIRRVRNEFAHKVKMSFEVSRVKNLCRNLSLRAKPYGAVTVSTRGEFTSAAVALILNLTNRPHYVAQRALTYGNWKY